jgi:hypothetical protein
MHTYAHTHPCTYAYAHLWQGYTFDGHSVGGGPCGAGAPTGCESSCTPFMGGYTANIMQTMITATFGNPSAATARYQQTRHTLTNKIFLDQSLMTAKTWVYNTLERFIKGVAYDNSFFMYQHEWIKQQGVWKWAKIAAYTQGHGHLGGLPPLTDWDPWVAGVNNYPDNSGVASRATPAGRQLAGKHMQRRMKGMHRCTCIAASWQVSRRPMHVHLGIPTYARGSMPTYARKPMPTYARGPMPTYARAPMLAYARAPMPAYARAPMPTYARAPMPMHVHLCLCTCTYACLCMCTYAGVEEPKRKLQTSPQSQGYSSTLKVTYHTRLEPSRAYAHAPTPSMHMHLSRMHMHLPHMHMHQPHRRLTTYIPSRAALSQLTAHIISQALDRLCPTTAAAPRRPNSAPETSQTTHACHFPSPSITPSVL